MLDIIIKKELTVNFDDFLRKIGKEDIEQVIQKISSNFENWKVDTIILNSIVNIILNISPNSGNLKDIDTEKLSKLLEIAKG